MSGRPGHRSPEDPSVWSALGDHAPSDEEGITINGRYRPVVAIEVFGLITSPVDASTGRPLFPDTFTADVTFSRDRWPRTIGAPTWDRSGRSVKTYAFNRPGIEWVKEMAALGYEVVWSSAWTEYANDYFGELLGLPHLENVFDPTGHTRVSLPDMHIAGVAERYPRRPVLLTLDFPAPGGGDALGLARDPRDRFLSRVESFPWFSTATPEQLKSMTDWLKLTTTPEGHRELTRRRRELLLRREHDNDYGDERAPFPLRSEDANHILTGGELGITEAATINRIAERVRQELHDRIDEGLLELTLLRYPDNIARAIERIIQRSAKTADDKCNHDGGGDL